MTPIEQAMSELGKRVKAIELDIWGRRAKALENRELKKLRTGKRKKRLWKKYLLPLKKTL